VHGIGGVGVGNLDDWTPAVPTLVLSALRANLALLSHLALDDPQLPAACLRLRRLVHYLVWVGDAQDQAQQQHNADGSSNSPENKDVNEADLWAIATLLHIRQKLVQIRSALYGFTQPGDDPMEEAFGPLASKGKGQSAVSTSSSLSASSLSSDAPMPTPASPVKAMGFTPLKARIDQGKHRQTLAFTSSDDLARAVFCYRSFPYAAWEEYSAEENAAIGAALSASPLQGRVALPGPETGTSFEVTLGIFDMDFNPFARRSIVCFVHLLNQDLPNLPLQHLEHSL